MKITKCNNLVEARYFLKLHEQKVILATIAIINPLADVFPETVTLSALDIARIYKTDQSNAYKHLKAMEGFIGSGRNVVTLNDKSNGDWHKAVWVSEVKYHKSEGRLDISFSPSIRKYLHGLHQRFTTFNISNVAELRSVYSIRMYELLAQFKSTGRRDITVTSFREVLGIPFDKYTLFSSLRRKVIERSIDELNDKANMNIFVNYKKSGKTVSSIHFFFEYTS